MKDNVRTLRKIAQVVETLAEDLDGHNGVGGQEVTTTDLARKFYQMVELEGKQWDTALTLLSIRYRADVVGAFREELKTAARDSRALVDELAA